MAQQIITYDGRRFTPAFRDAIIEARRLLPFAVRITQGGFNVGGVAASAGTHNGDAVDFSVAGLAEEQVAQLVSTLRRVGIAAWFRTTSVAKWGTRAQGFSSYHVHGVPNGWASPSAGAASQATSYRQGKDGLARNLADLGPGHVSTYRLRTWAAYQQLDRPGLPSTGANPAPSIPTPQEDIMTPEQEKRLMDAIGAVATGTYSRTALTERDTATQRAVWSDTKVQRSGKAVAAIQELADAKTGIIAVQGQLAGLTSALQSMAAGQGVDLAAVEAAAKRGAQDALKGVAVKIEMGG